MDRRHFLAAGLAAAAGCGRPGGPAPDPLADREAAEVADRARHLEQLANFRVPAGATRTTPPPPVGVTDQFPQLKPLAKVAVRLHPRYGDEPAAGESKVGGSILWPADEPWPAEAGEWFAAVLQLRAEDAPPQVAFRPGTDLLQLLWWPGAAAPDQLKPRVFWRTRAAVSGATGAMSRLPGLVPVPCRVFPERVAEFPAPDLMPRHMREEVEKWFPPGGGSGAAFFADRLAAAPGVKVGGWPRWSGPPRTPHCATCRRLTDYLLTVDPAEWDDATKPRWQPTEERAAADDAGFRSASGLALTGAVHVFVCRNCDDWPATAVTPVAG